MNTSFDTNSRHAVSRTTTYTYRNGSASKREENKYEDGFDSLLSEDFGRRISSDTTPRQADLSRRRVAEAPLPTPDAILRLEVKNSASSVVLAFRELQAKAKQIEHERIAATREVEELRRKLAENKRNEALQKSRAEIQTTDEVLWIRESSEKLLVETTDIQAKISRVTEYSQSVHRDIATQRTRLSELTEEVARGHTEAQSLEYRISQLTEDLQQSIERCNQLESRILAIPGDRSKIIDAELRMNSVQTKISKERNAALRASVRISALQKYFDIILQINADLTESIKSREESSNRIFRIVENQTGKFYGSHVSNQQESLRRSSTRESAAINRISQEAVRRIHVTKQSNEKNITSSLLKSRHRAGIKTSTKKTTKKSSKGKKLKKQKKRSILSDGSSSSADENSASINRMYADGEYEAAITRRLGQMAAERAEGRRIQATDTERSELRRSKREDDDSDLIERHRRGSNHSDSAADAARRVQSRAQIRRRVARPPRPPVCRGRSPEASSASDSPTRRRRASSAPSLNDSFDRNSSRSDWLLRPQDRDALSERHGSPPSSNRGRNRDSAVYAHGSRRRRSLSRESGIVQTAARLAATAAATAAAAAASAEGSAQIGRVFIPSSPATSKEFNVVASVSKAARSARELNATLASKCVLLYRFFFSCYIVMCIFSI